MAFATSTPFKLLLLLLATTVTGVPESCSELNDNLSLEMAKVVENTQTTRWVDSESGIDSFECLKSTSPCATLNFALFGLSEGQTPVQDIVVNLNPGSYVLIGGLFIVNSMRVAVIGADRDSTFISCGEFGDTDRVCDYMNFEFRNSSHLLVAGVTFTGCGPITSNVYIAKSDFVFFENCTFRDNFSPPVLIYDTPVVLFRSVLFTDNHPSELPPSITHDTCYFSGGQDVFFLDNRTSSGGISFYVEDWPTRFLIQDCVFLNNSARPDPDVSLPRRSGSYGHGGALNIRLLNSSGSSVCIENSVFEFNYAEAHAGALAIAVAGESSLNAFYVRNATFERNRCVIDNCTGGAVGIDLFAGTSFNKFEFTDSRFTRNKAQVSGAISLATLVSATPNADGISDILILLRCSFERNEAFFEGTALGAYSLTHTNQIGIPVNITDCHFRDNQGSEGSADTTSVTVYRVLISFQGNCSFLDNQGGGISLLGSRMDVRGSVVFDGNTAVFGGAIAMSGRSQVLLYSGSNLHFENNFVSELGAGIYVEYPSSDFILTVLNTACFIRYFNASVVDTPPQYWNARVSFVNNTAGLAGAAIYANDMSSCKWLGPLVETLPDDTLIFQIPNELGGPFSFSNNSVVTSSGASENSQTASGVMNEELATDPSSFTAFTEFNTSEETVSYGERVSYHLTSLDQLDSFREAVYSINAPLVTQTLGSLSSNGTVFVYEVDDRGALEGEGGVSFVNDSASITTSFSLLRSQAAPYDVKLRVGSCHPGYYFSNDSQLCVCRDQDRGIVRCDGLNRYFYTQDNFWVGLRPADNSTYFSNTIPGFLNCTRQGRLPGCLFQFDRPNDQCAPGRVGTLCGDCLEGFGATFDLRYCRDDCGAGGIILFIAICLVTLVGSLAVLYFDTPIPNELKGVIFFAQVIGVIYRNTPYLQLLRTTTGAFFPFFDFIINMLGFAMPFQVCLGEGIPPVAMAFLGYTPPVIATLTAVFYYCLAKRVKMLSQRESYGFHGFYFLWIFVYKYLVDTSFIFVSCTNLDGDYRFLYQGSIRCLSKEFIPLLVLGAVLLAALAVALPAYILYIIYQPQKAIQASNAITHGLKSSRRYLWYGVWDIWRRVLFVGANLFISVAPRAGVLFIHCLLVWLCLSIVCLLKPYKKPHINISEALIILCLFGATLAILDDGDIHVGPVTSIVAISLPFVYGALFIGFKICKKLFEFVWGRSSQRWELGPRVKPLTETYAMVELKLKAFKHKTHYIFSETAAKPADEQEGGERHSGGGGGEGERGGEGEEGRRETEEDESLANSQFREPLLDPLPAPARSSQ